MQKIIGYYWFPWAGCAPGWGEVQYAKKPIYGKREGQHGLQVLVQSLGMLAWINASPHDVVLQ